MPHTIVFKNQIARLVVKPERKVENPDYKIVENYRVKVGVYLLFFPVYQTLQRAVLYDRFFSGWGYLCTPEEFNSSGREYRFKGDVLYRKPKCEIWTTDGKCTDRFFETDEEMFDFEKGIRKECGTHIEVDHTNTE
jgi:hypothetical protein